ncbi:MAG: sodium:solute symporter family protein, partial [Candidatus Binatia bacterium]
MDVEFTVVDAVVIVAYVAGMLAIGAWVGRRHPGLDGYLVAGRGMTTPLLICTLVSTFYGVDVLFGTSELAYEEGVVAWFTYSRPMYLFLLVAAFLLAGRLREHGFRTLPDVLAHHYGRPTQVTGAIASFVYALPSLGLFGLGRLFHALFGWEPWIGAALFGGVALVYTLQGGLLADALTDTIQFVMMALTLAVAVPIVMSRVGGFGVVEETMGAAFFAPLGAIPGWLAFVYASTGLVVLVEPAFYQRIFAARSARDVRNALLAGILLWAAYDWCVTAAGMLAAAAVEKGLLAGGFHSAEALVRVVFWALPVGLAGVFFAGILAAEMSTIDSYCLVAGGNLAYDIYRPLARRPPSEGEMLRLTRFGVLLSWVVGFVIAFLFERLLALWVFTSTLLVATVLVPVLAGLYWKGRVTKLAGLLGCAGGFASAIIYYVVLHSLGAPDEEYGTFIWTFTLGGREFSLWQEYAIFFSLPASAAGFAIGNLTGRSVQPPPM